MLNKALITTLPAILFAIAPFSAYAGEPPADLTPLSESILDHYVHATADQKATSPGSMEVEISASIPKLQQNGRLRALRIISKVGRISYRVLGFQGSNTVKNQVIARYLQAEQQGQSDPKLALTPVNYKFKLKCARTSDAGRLAYVFAVTPRRSAPGLFKGELWLDQATYLPIHEKGRLSKSPSIFFKRVDFERNFAVQDGQVVPQNISSVITTRVVGKVELTVNYSNYEHIEGESEDAAPASEAVSAP